MKTLRISFDLDDMLVATTTRLPTRGPSIVSRIVGGEPMRIGSRGLLRRLRSDGHRLWVYTTSGRSCWRLRLWFWAFGVRLEGVVNQERHRSMLESQSKSLQGISKYPPAFGIQLHIDDSAGVVIEGQRFGFDVHRIAPDQEDWTNSVLEAVQQHSRS